MREDDIFLYIWFIGQQNHGSFLSFRGYPLSRNPLFTRNHCKNIGKKKCTSIFLLLLLIGWKAHTFFHFCHKGWWRLENKFPHWHYEVNDSPIFSFFFLDESIFVSFTDKLWIVFIWGWDTNAVQPTLIVIYLWLSVIVLTKRLAWLYEFNGWIYFCAKIWTPVFVLV